MCFICVYRLADALYCTLQREKEKIGWLLQFNRIFNNLFMFSVSFNLNNHLNEFPEIVQYTVIMLEINGFTDSLERLSISLKIV